MHFRLWQTMLEGPGLCFETKLSGKLSDTSSGEWFLTWELFTSAFPASEAPSAGLLLG